MAGLRIVFMGTPDFAVASLKALIEDGIEVVGVITAPDRPAGRGQQLRASAVKNYAVEQNLNILQPTNLKAPEFIEELQALSADLFVVVAFRMLPEVVWNMPPKGTINLHGSLLPQYRGAAPINRAIMNGEAETGVTTFFIRKEIDTGEIIDSAKVSIGPDDTAGQVHDTLMETGAELLAKTVRQIEGGTQNRTSQESLIAEMNELNEAPKIFKDDCKIDWTKPAQDVYNHMRGLIPYPAPWCEIVDADGKVTMVKIYAARLEANSTLECGQIDTDAKNYLKVGASGGSINILELQIAGKKRMPVKALLNGFKITADWKFQ